MFDFEQNSSNHAVCLMKIIGVKEKDHFNEIAPKRHQNAN